MVRISLRDLLIGGHLLFPSSVSGWAYKAVSRVTEPLPG